MTALQPPLPDPQPVVLPPVRERVLDNGLRVLAVEQGGVYRTELRLSLPIGRGATPDVAAITLLSRTLLSRTGEALLQMGGTLGASADVEALRFAGGVFSGNLADLLRLVADVVGTPSFDVDTVEAQRRRLAQEVQGAGRRPELAAAALLVGGLYGSHPYGQMLPSPDEVAAVQPDDLRRLLAERVCPSRGAMVLVGNADAEALLDAAEDAFAGWRSPAVDPMVRPETAPPGPMRLVDRPGAVQTLVLLGGPAPNLGEPDDGPLQVAAAVLGGYGSARLAQNLRARRGFAYSVEVNIQRRLLASHVVASAAVSTAVTGPTLVELRYELGRLATEAVEASELEAAKRHLCGKLSRSTQTKAGLANLLAGLSAGGLPPGFLTHLTSALEQVSADDVLAAAGRYLAPRALQGVVVGDAVTIRDTVARLEAVDG